MDTETHFWKCAVEGPEHSHERYGQFLFNLLHTLRPDLANQIRGTSNDPFYDNEVIFDFVKWVGENWHV